MKKTLVAHIKYLLQTYVGNKLQKLPKILLIAVTCYIIVISAIALIKHYLFFTSAWDLGIFDQILHFSLHGKLFQYNVEPWFTNSLPANFLAVHVAPILLTLIPFYALAPRPETLLVLQPAIVALAAIPLFSIANDELGNEKLALTVSLVYLFHPGLIGGNLFDFHMEAFMPLTIFLTVYFLRRRAWKPFMLSFIAALGTLEYSAIVLIFVFFCELIRSRRYKTIRGLGIFMLLMVVSVLYFVSADSIITYFRNPEWKGITIHGIALNKLVTEPASIFLDCQNKITYILLMLAPYAFIPLARPLYLLPIVPWLGVAFITNYTPYYSIEYQYSFIFIPVVALSFIDGLKVVKNSISHNQLTKILKVSVTIVLIVCMIILPRRYLTNPYYSDQLIRAQTVHEVLKLIPYGASVITQNDIFPHLSSSENTYSLPWNPFGNPLNPNASESKLRWVEKLLREVEVDYIVFDFKRMLPRLADLAVSEVAGRNDYGIYAFADYVMIFKRGFDETPVLAQHPSFMLNHKNLVVINGTKIEDRASTSQVVLAHFKENGTGTFWFGPYTVLPPFEGYEVTFRLKLGSYTDDYIITLDVVDNGSKEILTRRELGSGDLTVGEWVDVSLSFVNDKFRYRVEFRGININKNVELYLDYIKVEQTV